jgi:N-acetylmuramoyl-L-alanine amidase
MVKYLAFLDDGHGILTPGKRTPYIPELKRYIKENEFNAPVVDMLAEELKRSGVDVYLTAPTDDDTSLRDRVDYANKIYWQYCSKYGAANVKAVFISIHYNAFDGKFDSRDPKGHSVHIYPGHRHKDAGKLADNIGKHLRGGTPQQWRGIVEQDLYITRETVMPAILSENGFMDNKSEALLMLNKDFQYEVSLEHAKGACDYFDIKHVPKKTSSISPGVYYRVVAGSFSSKANANDQVSKLKSKGIDSFLDAYQQNGKTYYRVVAGSFSDRSNAERREKVVKAAGFSTFIAIYKK